MRVHPPSLISCIDNSAFCSCWLLAPSVRVHREPSGNGNRQTYIQYMYIYSLIMEWALPSTWPDCLSDRTVIAQGAIFNCPTGTSLECEPRIQPENHNYNPSDPIKLRFELNKLAKESKCHKSAQCDYFNVICSSNKAHPLLPHAQPLLQLYLFNFRSCS